MSNLFSGGSPVLKKRGAIINLDSDSDSDVQETACLDPEEKVLFLFKYLLPT